MVFSVMKRLDALGVTYYSRGKITPRTFIAGKMLCAAAGFILGLILNPPMAIVFAEDGLTHGNMEMKFPS